MDSCRQCRVQALCKALCYNQFVWYVCEVRVCLQTLNSGNTATSWVSSEIRRACYRAKISAVAHLEQLPEECNEVRPFTDAFKRLKRSVNQLNKLGPIFARLGVRCQTCRRSSATCRISKNASLSELENSRPRVGRTGLTSFAYGTV